MVRTVTSMFGFYVINQNEIGVVLSLGKLSKIVGPGMHFKLPMIHQVIKTISSLQTIDLPEQQITLEGNIAVHVSGSVNFRVVDAGRALLGMANYQYSMQQLALVTISEVLGNKTIEQVRTAKKQIADEIEIVVAERAAEWGLGKVDIRLHDARLEEGLQRAMMRETEAQKEARAVQIKAEADRQAAQIFADAARTLASAPGAMTLRVLQTLSDISNDKSTVIIPIPVELMNGLGGGSLAAGARPALGASRYPEGRLVYDQASKKSLVVCPSCSKSYDVSRILGDSRYDSDPSSPGQQMTCDACNTMFTFYSRQA